jgi:hypothetical protein
MNVVDQRHVLKHKRLRSQQRCENTLNVGMLHGAKLQMRMLIGIPHQLAHLELRVHIITLRHVTSFKLHAKAIRGKRPE